VFKDVIPMDLRCRVAPQPNHESAESRRRGRATIAAAVDTILKLANERALLLRRLQEPGIGSGDWRVLSRGLMAVERQLCPLVGRGLSRTARVWAKR
jgi:hypothetical protein